MKKDKKVYEASRAYRDFADKVRASIEHRLIKSFDELEGLSFKAIAIETEDYEACSLALVSEDGWTCLVEGIEGDVDDGPSIRIDRLALSLTMEGMNHVGLASDEELGEYRWLRAEYEARLEEEQLRKKEERDRKDYERLKGKFEGENDDS